MSIWIHTHTREKEILPSQKLTQLDHTSKRKVLTMNSQTTPQEKTPVILGMVMIFRCKTKNMIHEILSELHKNLKFLPYER